MKSVACVLSGFAMLGLSVAHAGTVAYWPFDSIDGSAGLTDAVGSYDLSVVTGAFAADAAAAVASVPNPDTSPGFSGDPSANPDSGLANASLLCPGSSGQERLTVSSDPGNVFNLSGKSFTFEGWFQHEGDAPSAWGDIIGGTRIGSPYVGYVLKMNDSGVIECYLSDGSNTFSAITSGTDYNDSTFHHFALIWQDSAGDNAKGLVSIYIDGVPEATASAPVGWNAAAADSSDNAFTIAGRAVDGCNWDGRFDEFRFSDTALTPSEFLNGSSGPDTNAPTIFAFSPANNATGASPTADLVASFNENIMTNTSGSIVITNLSNNTGTSIAIGDTSQVSVSGRFLTIDPTADLVADMQYAVLIDANAIMDLSTNYFAGITSTSTWSFTTSGQNVMTNGGYWADGANWSGGAMPSGEDTAVINTNVYVSYQSATIDVYTGDLILRAGARIDLWKNGAVGNYLPQGAGSQIYCDGNNRLEFREGVISKPLVLLGDLTIEKGDQGTALTITGPISGDGHLTYRNHYWGGRELKLNNASANTYTGGSTIREYQAGAPATLFVYANDAFGTGDVTLDGKTASSVTLDFAGSTTDVIDDGAGIYLTGSAIIDLNSRNETVNKLFIDGEPQVKGTWGSGTSGADNTNATHFAGSGVLTVLNTDIPPAGTVLIIK